MYLLSDTEIDFILKDIQSRGIVNEDIQNNLLDHVCIMVEKHLEVNGDFHEFYSSVIKTFYRNNLSELEEQTQILLTYRTHLALSRKQFSILLFSIFIGPFIAYNMLWIDVNWQSARWDIPFEIWGNSIAYGLWPLLIYLVIFLTPDKFEPLVPKNSVVLLGLKPFLKVIPPV